MTTKRHLAAIAAASTFLLAASAATAFADNLVADGDLVANGTQSTVNFGTVPCNSQTAGSVGVWVTRNGNGQVFGNGAALSVSATAAPAGVSVGSAGPIVLPATWQTSANNAQSAHVTVPVSVTPTVSGSPTGTLTLSVSGPGTTAGTTVTRSVDLTVTWTTDCTPKPPPNTPPTSPGTPVASAGVTQGGFGLTWSPSTDAQNNAFTYSLEGRDASAAGWQTVATGLTSPSYSFGTGAPTEGTWTYRVQAVETSTSPALASDYSGTSSPVVVDRTGPYAPAANPDRAPEYTGATGNWWKDSVTVSFASNGDPALADGSAGSGVTQVSAPQTFASEGAFSAVGLAQDAAGNSSASTELDGSVDAVAPTVTATCPASVTIGSASTASWTAADEAGGSGLATPAAGTLALDTAAVGPHTATIPAGTAQDNVGHQSAAVTCTYSVIYNFAGFFQPVSMTGMNVVKAGSGVPIKFSLGGNYGLGVLAANPQFAVAGTAQSGGVITDTVTAGSSSLTYDSTAGQYIYVWKTDKSWAGQSGTLTVTLNDGTVHTAQFSFTK